MNTTNQPRGCSRCGSLNHSLSQCKWPTNLTPNKAMDAYHETKAALVPKTETVDPATLGEPTKRSGINLASALDVQVAGSHYKDCKIQPIEFIHANGIPFAEGCVIKYVSRWRAKGGIKDLEKARHFLDLLIELELRAEGEG